MISRKYSETKIRNKDLIFDKSSHTQKNARCSEHSKVNIVMEAAKNGNIGNNDNNDNDGSMGNMMNNGNMGNVSNRTEVWLTKLNFYSQLIIIKIYRCLMEIAANCHCLYAMIVAVFTRP